MSKMLLDHQPVNAWRVEAISPSHLPRPRPFELDPTQARRPQREPRADRSVIPP